MPRGKHWTLELFMAKVAKAPGAGCWEWTGYRDANGYGCTQFHMRGERTHRLSWLLHFGSPGKQHVCHRCDNPPCVRPEHLFLGTAFDNVLDMRLKRRHGTTKLSWEIVGQIKNLYRGGAFTQAELAANFGVRQTMISRIVRGECWNTSPRNYVAKKHLTRETVIALRAARAEGHKLAAIAKNFGIGIRAVTKAISRETWKDVP